MNINLLCEAYLHSLYHPISVKTLRSYPKKNISETYGEILYSSIDKLLSIIHLKSSDIFIDFGSGVGKIPFQVFLKSDVKKVYGIEILPELHEHAVSVLKKIKEDLPEFFIEDRQLIFFHGNFLENLFLDATVALINSTCFTQALLNALGKIIDSSDNIHTVISLRPIASFSRLKFKKTIRIECSWDSALAFLYQV